MRKRVKKGYKQATRRGKTKEGERRERERERVRKRAKGERREER